MPDPTCPNCHRELPAHAAFCLGCGAELRGDEDDRPTEDPDAPSDEAREGSRRLCPTCGVTAPEERRSCEWCEGALDRPIEAPVLDDGTYPVAVRCHFQCRSCGHMSPLNQLDLDGTVRCLRCGLDQVFDVGSWVAALNHAHGVGDLAGPEPEGRHPHPRVSIAGDNPLASIGRYRTSARMSQTGTSVEDGMVVPRSLRIDASPGHPLCPDCDVPVALSASGGTLTTRCGTCGTAASYEVDPEARRLCPGLRGVAAEAARGDRPRVRLAEAGPEGASVIRCPGCGAAMKGIGDAPTATCEFCQTVARVPGQVRHELFDHEPDAETWWLLFQGPSNHRREIEACDDLADEALGKVEAPPMVKGPLLFRLVLGTVVPLAALIATFVLLWGTRIPSWLR